MASSHRGQEADPPRCRPAAGVPYPHGCRTGECGSCKTRLLSGDVSMTAYDRAVLSQSERAEGLILVCRARPRSDVHIAWLGMDEDESLPTQRMTGQVTNVEVLTPDIRRIYVWPERPLQFAAGQYVRLGFGTLPFRSYSMANRPDEEVLEFHIRLVPSGVASRYVADHLKPGERIRLEGPAGSAHLRPDHDGPIVAVAGGTGLVPILSIVRTRLQTGSTQPIWLYVGARTNRDAYNETALGELTMRYPNLKVNIALSSEGHLLYHAGLLHEVVGRDISYIPEAKCYWPAPRQRSKPLGASCWEQGSVRQTSMPIPSTGAQTPNRINPFMHGPVPCSPGWWDPLGEVLLGLSNTHQARPNYKQPAPRKPR